MSNTTRNVNEDISDAVYRLRIRTFKHKALPPDKQKEFTIKAQTMLDRISANTEEAIRLV